jgi:outer membrane receptor protein involved in Fe transport
MSIETAPARQSPSQRLQPGQVPFRLNPIAAIVAGMAILASGSLHAAEPSVAELQAEIAKLKQIIAAQNAAADSNKDVAATGIPAREEPQTLGEVTVNSAPAIETLHDVPLAISIVSGGELENTGATSMAAITQRLSNVTWNVGNQRTDGLSIRGIGKVGQTEAQDPDVGITVDGVSYAYNPLVSAYDFTDVDTASVIKGPQGTLGNKSTGLGVVNITTNRPSFTPSADYSLTFGQNDTFVGKLAAGGPIIDNLLAWRGNFTVDRGDGNMLNLYNNGTTYTNTDRVSGRVQFLLTPSPDFNARFSLNVQPQAGEAQNNATINTPTPTVFANGSVNPLSTDAATRLTRSWFTQEAGYSYLGTYLYGAGQNAVDLNAQQPLNTSSHGASAELNWTFGKHTLTSITAFQDYYFDAVNDEGTPFDIATNSGGFQNYFRQISQELRIASQPGGFVDYQAGLYFLKDSNNDYYNKGWGSDAGAFYATNAQYKTLDATAAGQLLMQNSLNRLSMLYGSPAGLQDIENKNDAIFGNTDWHLSDKLTLTTGLRISHEDRENTGGSSVIDNGYGAALNPVQVNGVQLGGFATTSTGTLAANNSAAQLSLADSVAHQYFGTQITGVAGAAYKSLTAAQQLQVASAQALRAGQIGVLSNNASAQSYKGNLPTVVLAPSYKINDNYTTYVSWKYGEKGGISQFTNGISNLAQPERTRAFEWGLKTTLPDKKLTVNADLYFMDIYNYQQAVRVVDVYTTAVDNDGTIHYTSATGNAPKVQSKGLEVDAVYGGVQNTNIRFSGAYNDARYVSFPNSAQPVENGYTGAAPYRSVSGQTLAGAAKLTFNIGADYRVPVWHDKLFHTSVNTAYTSKYNSDVSLSEYAWIPAHSVTDFSIGLSNSKQNFDVSLIAKNLFNDATPQLQTWDSYTPAIQRWLGVQFSGKL